MGISYRLRRQRGAFAIISCLVLLVLLGFIGMALDLSQLYNRKAELQALADATALAAARQLNGTAAGVAAALTQAGKAATSMNYRYNQAAVVWSNSAISFSASASAPAVAWLDAVTAGKAAAGLLFARVDTKALDGGPGVVNTVFMGLLSSALASATTQAQATAGRSTVNVAPLAVCAMAQGATAAAASRSNPGPPANTELVEYGFRRGVAYDLMQLNPGGTSAANFVIDPLDPVGTLGSSANTAAAVVATAVCTGSMPIPSVMGGPLTVQGPFPLGALYQQLNSRFDQYTGNPACSPNGAPPDYNVRPYVYSAIGWMSTVPAGQTAQSLSSAGELWTIADPLSASGNTAKMYGPLWAYAKAVPMSSYTAAAGIEPASGYTPFATGAWTTLYPPGPVSLGYPVSTTPYLASSGANFLAPSAANAPGVRLRRVLNVPLLACPVASGSAVFASVLAIGRFFMTVPATSSRLAVEFGGVVPEQSLAGAVELYP